MLGVLRVGATDLDLEHLRRWAAHAGVDDLLARALGEAGLQT